jgi:hypothetical protein
MNKKNKPDWNSFYLGAFTALAVVLLLYGIITTLDEIMDLIGGLIRRLL